MARNADDEFADMPGQDSFLDVLTNMVGIIILLVVVTALRASQATVRAAVESVQQEFAAEAVAPLARLDDAKRAVEVAETDLKSTLRQTVEVRDEATLRELERSELTAFIAAVDHELRERREALSSDQQHDYDLRRKLAEAQRTLEDLNREQVAILTQPTEGEVEAIENQPTPLARRSTGREVLLQLSAGHLAVIPRELVDETINDVNGNLWRLREQDHFVRTVGPVNGFRLRYLVGMVAVKVGVRPDPNVPGAAQIGGVARPELIWYEIIPEKTPLGEPMAEALQPNSELRQVLQEHPADTAVVVIAVYPDSIRELHKLKRELYAAGYATAEVPCVAGLPIKGSPRAPRSGQIFVQ